ncbi:CRISPR-associated protein Cas1 [Actinoalloteichus hoggarensis]|uniref:CRISPR-associated endonuclease Cas1 n=1 Tax=Actinoalloteichus hoggarensis TaxID=1470176 RepID=A0A221W4W8_9PSEU|nr:type I-E CRISPR-associated endonuclease Cas1e [Actinoalloteichus hoggarensis]ASO20763.1 CRISPR-associated endonuclease Cas1 [Actinoalloteichus hoggarensis]MBB5920693.1 CRISPR-associated protein Cas1 [Actinoalloteichus hoggarensis]
MTTMPDPRRLLTRPAVAMLPRLADSLSFLYLENVRIVQEDTGVCAQVQRQDGETSRVFLPTAAVSCVLLGTGTSVTNPAMATFARHDTTVVWTGSGGVRMYSGAQASGQSTKWLERQVRLWADDTTRLAVAATMYEKRFGLPVPPGTSLDGLRGLEGARMKSLYHAMAEQHRIRGFRRNYNPENWDAQNPVNQALSTANAALYGVVHSVMLALGVSPGLGFLHSGKQHSFVYDVADLYKARHTIPLAFALHRHGNPDREVRRRLREDFRLYRLMPQIVLDIQRLLTPAGGTEPAELDEPEEVELVHLWDPDLGAVEAGRNHAHDVDW